MSSSFKTVIALLLMVFTATAAGAADAEVTFTFQPGGSPGAVYLAGSFNSWSPDKDLMKDEDGDGIYEITLKLAPGEYQYKFVVDGSWQADPAAAAETDDGYGGTNSVVEVHADLKPMVVGVAAGGAAAAASAPAEKPAAELASGGDVRVTFLFEVDKGQTSQIYLAGSFNGWDPTAELMTDDDGDGIYVLVKQMAPGKYDYKFVQDGNWLTDENAAEFTDDGFGGQNSVLTVAAGTPMIVGMYSTVPDGIEGVAPVAGAAGAGAAAAGQGMKEVTFRFQPVISGVSNIFLAGSFNDWNDSKTKMTDEDGDGAYEATMMLAVGRHSYKFVVDGNWMTDENADDFEEDGFGGKNSVIVVDDRYDDIKTELGDGEMMNKDISLVMDYSMVNPLAENSIEFKTRAHLGDVETVQMLYVVDGAENIVDMPPYGEDVVFEYYRHVLEVPASSQVSFTFLFADGGALFFATPAGFIGEKPATDAMFQYDSEKVPPFFTPDWAKDGIFYQIFPERFANGDKSNDQDFKEFYYDGVTELPESGQTNGEYFHFVQNWYDVSGLTRSPYRTDGKPDYYSFYGGDIAGVMEKIPYLADLGVTIIYFNPLNEARSNHKYDPMDYKKLDPHFADEATFKEFVKKAHDNGIRIIVDKAFNHTGNYFFAFLDAVEKGRESEYWNWYEFKRWPLPEGDIPNPLDYYDCWWGFGIHPNLNFDLSKANAQENAITDISDAQPNEPLVEYLREVARYWLGELDIDGFRLDVPNEVPHWFWKEFRVVVDEVKPDAFLIGEIWGNAMPWMGPHGFHSTMNYKYFRDPVLKFFGQGHGSAAQLDNELAPGRSLYPLQATQVMMNLVDSHDTERFLTTAGNKSERLMIATLFQMTYVGIPQIYYGDEVGVRGGKDPDCRRTFPWNWEESPRRVKVHDFYRKVIGIRKEYPALRTGTFHTVLTEGKLYSFIREDDANRIVVALNNGGAKSKLKLELEPLTGAILVLQ